MTFCVVHLPYKVEESARKMQIVVATGRLSGCFLSTFTNLELDIDDEHHAVHFLLTPPHFHYLVSNVRSKDELPGAMCVLCRES